MVGLKVVDVMERTKCGAEGWRRNGKKEVVRLKVGDVMERTKCGLKVGDVMERTKWWG